VSGVDLVQWLGVQLDEDERIALKSVEQAIVNLAGADAASVANWHVAERPATGTFVATRDQWGRAAEIVPTYGGAHAAHIAEHDPARVLREIESKRRLIKLIFLYEAKIDGEWGCCHAADQIEAGLCEEIQPDDVEALRLLALPYSDRPGYRAEWAPTG
jgi:Family of unknown function (DUF6221)